MDMLKKFFPFSFTEKKDLTALIVNIVIYVAAGWAIGFVIGLLNWIPLVGFMLNLVGKVVDLYVLVGVVLSALDYMKVLK